MKDIREIDKPIKSFTLNKTDKGRYLLYIEFVNNSRINIFLDILDLSKLLRTIGYHFKVKF